MEPLVKLYEAWKERMKDPFLGRYLITFSLFNWKFLFFLLTSDKEPSHRIYYAIKYYIDGYGSFLFPLGIVMISFVIVPLFNWLNEGASSLINSGRESTYFKNREASISKEINLILRQKQLENVDSIYEEIIGLEMKLKDSNLDIENLRKSEGNLKTNLSDLERTYVTTEKELRFYTLLFHLNISGLEPNNDFLSNVLRDKKVLAFFNDRSRKPISGFPAQSNIGGKNLKLLQDLKIVSTDVNHGSRLTDLGEKLLVGIHNIFYNDKNAKR